MIYDSWRFFFSPSRISRRSFATVKTNRRFRRSQRRTSEEFAGPALGTIAAPPNVGSGEGMIQMKVVDVMTATPLTVKATESVGTADELMAENGIRQIPVVEDGELVGIVTDRDLRAYLSDALLASPERHAKALSTPVQDIMTSEPLCLAPDDELEEAVEILIEQKFGAIPVVDEAEGLVGIVSYVDVLRCFLNRLREE
jgi:CBS domain-containing protein